MLRPVANADVLITMVVAAGEVQDRAADADRMDAMDALLRRAPTGFSAMTPERRREVSRMGGLTAAGRFSALKAFDLTAEEFHEYGRLRADGLSATEAVRKIRAAPPSEPPLGAA